ncbi:hypothetical protein A3D00_04490 [Candidatus Woesebacteria bacterium RIFCSPHIGHO2_02_FULL_38_9]|uniref:Polymerase beta nucleotidyltransferase domain-containing protein n=1 Tax=Candidatus Woesebacteria bacterium RIFCSPHIGHO2_01_FULL_39_28 TaxID=1802496 RepID=A0A1F7YGD2_9BACT|nr:MAG: hypothetical protein A2627_05845 [Candidatus Woesebacteria bacterium RIFCSPHIGHO2_01_FULL_39_28]OGM34949.1 MAG: hypothetical protein A3D00_04490 [Candidatus Woesebacteria bacterium RIFCSPHIGHO2_02_FULL_38_9]OGM57448.1 MAG: hypothetical protein A3A50_05960 [Candidatus Woesebacteria bacterium RIFCSPLOWO2_01_FULL_38_20]
MKYLPKKHPSKIALDKIRKKYGLEIILLHGSQVSGKQHAKSDVDVAVLPKKGVKINTLDLIYDLSNVFATDRVDIVNIAHANPLLLQAVMSKSILISGDKSLYQALKLKAFNLYNDYLPYLEIERKSVLKNLEKYVTA